MSVVTFIEWLKSKQTKEIDLNEAREAAYIFELFDSHYNIDKIYKNDMYNIYFYEFSINKRRYRIFIENIKTNIHIGFEKEDDFFMNRWYIEGIDNELKNGEVQKLFGTIIYVVKELYNQEYSTIQIQTNEDKKFRAYLRLVQQISKKLLPESIISHDNKYIYIHKTKKDSKEITNFLYKPKKK